MNQAEKFDRAVLSATAFLAGYVRQDSLALLQDESVPNTGIVVFKKDAPGRIAIYTDAAAESTKPKAAMLPGELLGYQTSHFLAAAGIPPDRKTDHSSKEWKLFMAGFDLAARLAGRLPSVLSDTQMYRTGYGEGVRDAAKRAEEYGAHLTAEAIRNLQSTAPVAQPADLPPLPAPLLYYRADEDGDIVWGEDCVCMDDVYSKPDSDSYTEPERGCKAFSEKQVTEYVARALSATPAAPLAQQSEPVGTVEVWNQGGSGEFRTVKGIDTLAHGTRLYAGSAPASPVPRGWKVEMIEKAVKITAPDGRWCGFAPGMISPRDAMTFDFLRSLAAPASTGPCSDGTAKDAAMSERADQLNAALMRAATELPELYSIRVEIERGAGAVEWFDEDGNSHIIDSEESSLAEDVQAALDAALSAAEQAEVKP